MLGEAKRLFANVISGEKLSVTSHVPVIANFSREALYNLAKVPNGRISAI